MATLHRLNIWQPALDVLLREAPASVDLVEFTGTVGAGSVGGSHRMDGGDPPRDWRSGLDLFDALLAVAKETGVQRVGVVLRTSRPEHIARLVLRLNFTGTERILELGAAPGVAVARIGRLLTGDSHITAVDRSATGTTRIVERNQGLVDAGRLTVVQQDLTTIAPGPPPFARQGFDVIFASNVNVFWTHPAKANVATLAALLTTRGRIHLFYGYGPTSNGPAGKASRVADTLRHDDALTAVTVDGVGAPVEISARRA